MHQSGNAHWVKIAARATRDAVLFAAAYILANYARFSMLFRMDDYVLPITAGSVTLASSLYILGLYSVESHRRKSFTFHLILLSFGFALALLAVTLVGYLSFDQRVGRGFMAIGCVFSYPLLVLNHWLLYHKSSIAPARVAVIVESPEQQAEYERLMKAKLHGIHVIGFIGENALDLDGENSLGPLRNLRKIIRHHKIDRVVFGTESMNNETTRVQLRQLRYLGFACSSILALYESTASHVPMRLINLDWLIQTENTSRDLYFSKLKRLFDIVSSLVLLGVLSPAVLAGTLIVKIYSPSGPVFFKQQRVGRFGKKFWIYKLRSMRTDAEHSGPVWSVAGKDPRVFPGGALLRKYRIDEIPQLINVLKGEMSFVGPRPERPEFVSMLAKEIPFYNERHMIHPGLTGWAQVCYPYGSSVEDASRKLEYDLYYLKHAGVIFDFLILLDTIRVVLGGGLKQAAVKQTVVPSVPDAVNAP